LIADAHNDLLLELVHRRCEDGPFRSRWLPVLRAGDVRVQVCALFAALEDTPERAVAVTLQQVAAFERAVREAPDEVVHVRSGADLDLVNGRVGLVLALEGCEPLVGRPELIDVFSSLGVRVVGLTWNGANAFANGAAGDPKRGLTPDGRALVDRLAGLGVLIDLSHAAAATFSDVLQQAPDADILVSHAGCRALYDTPRNLDDAQLRALAERGGFFGVMAQELALGAERATLDGFVDHVLHAVEVAGIDHVGLGSDFTRQINAALGSDSDSVTLPLATQPTSGIEGLSGPEDFTALAAALERRGVGGARLAAVLGGNLLRFLRRGLPA
jgi:membrane dipeptidase